jgi:hypothetical protein
LENINNENNTRIITNSNGATTIESESNNSSNNYVNNINLKNKLFDELLLYEEYYTYLGQQKITNFKNLNNNNLYSRLKTKIYNNLPKLLLDSI